MLEFIQLLEKKSTTHKALISCVLQHLQNGFHIKSLCFILSSKYFVRYLSEVSSDEDFRNIAIELTRKVFAENFSYWQSNSMVEQWLESRPIIPADEKEAILQRIGLPYFEQLNIRLKAASSWNEIINNLPTYDAIAERFAESTTVFKQFIHKFH